MVRGDETYGYNGHDGAVTLLQSLNITLRNEALTDYSPTHYRQAMRAITWLDHAIGHLTGYPRPTRIRQRRD